jgi:hypothetical protein
VKHDAKEVMSKFTELSIIRPEYSISEMILMQLGILEVIIQFMLVLRVNNNLF